MVAAGPAPEFDFDEWLHLARRDPAAFESQRSAMIEAHLHRFPPEHQPRLRCLQFRIDMERRRARHPMAACLRLYTMMWDALLGDQGLVAALNHLSDVPRQAPPPTPRQAKVIPFRVRH
jgi:hypothetical protein